MWEEPEIPKSHYSSLPTIPPQTCACFSLLINVLVKTTEQESEEKKIIISQWFLEKEGSLQGMQKRSHNEESCISEVRRWIDNMKFDSKQPSWIKPYSEMKINKPLFCYVNKKRKSEEAGLMYKWIKRVLV